MQMAMQIAPAFTGPIARRSPEAAMYLKNLGDLLLRDES
jgi:hypothetical protein